MAIAVTEIDEVLVGQHTVVGDDGLQLFKEAALDVKFLDNGFDHQPHGRRRVERADGLNARQRLCHGFSTELALGSQPVQRLGKFLLGLHRRTFAAVKKHHGVAGLRRHLRDADAHGAGTDHQ